MEELQSQAYLSPIESARIFSDLSTCCLQAKQLWWPFFPARFDLLRSLWTEVLLLYMKFQISSTHILQNKVQPRLRLERGM